MLGNCHVRAVLRHRVRQLSAISAKKSEIWHKTEILHFFKGIPTTLYGKKFKTSLKLAQNAGKMLFYSQTCLFHSSNQALPTDSPHSHQSYPSKSYFPLRILSKSAPFPTFPPQFPFIWAVSLRSAAILSETTWLGPDGLRYGVSGQCN